MLQKAVLMVLLVASAQVGIAQTQQSSYDETRKLLSSMAREENSASLAELFRTGDERIADLIKLLDDQDPFTSVRAQIVIRYLDNEAGMKALSQYYAQPGMRQVAGPKPLPSDERKSIPAGGSLAELVQQNCSCVKTEDIEYTHSRVLARSASGDKALIEIYINRGVLMEEWYHVVIKKRENGWQFVSIYLAAQS
jgi:hypothetical protein